MRFPKANKPTHTKAESSHSHLCQSAVEQNLEGGAGGGNDLVDVRHEDDVSGLGVLVVQGEVVHLAHEGPGFGLSNSGRGGNGHQTHRVRPPPPLALSDKVGEKAFRR